MSFGNRKLQDEDDIFDKNAWDDYEWTEDMEKKAQAVIHAASEVTMSAEQREKHILEASTFWDAFYGNHESKFFKNRKWITREFNELLTDTLCGGAFNSDTSVFPGKDADLRVLEVGCGAGNTITPIMDDRWRTEKKTFVYACDFSAKAVSVVQESHFYDTNCCFVFVQDISKPNLSWPFPPESIDAICCIFVLSAINPDDFSQTIRNMATCLRPGGIIFFRDYGRFDMAQMRFKNGSCIGENFYTRGDGTCVYFFEQDEVSRLFSEAGLSELSFKVDRRLLVNRRKRLKMCRVWLQGKYQKTFK